MDTRRLTLLLALGCSPILSRKDLELALPPVLVAGLAVSVLGFGCREHAREASEPNPTNKIYHSSTLTPSIGLRMTLDGAVS